MERNPGLTQQTLPWYFPGGFAFRVFEGIGELIEFTIRHAQRPPAVPPAGNRAFDLAQYLPGAIATQRTTAHVDRRFADTLEFIQQMPGEANWLTEYQTVAEESK